MDNIRSLFTAIAVQGKVYARGTDGILRVLEPGDALYLREVIITRGNSSLMLQAADGTFHEVRGVPCFRLGEDGQIVDMDQLPQDIQEDLNALEGTSPGDQTDSPDIPENNMSHDNGNESSNVEDSDTHGFVRISRINENEGIGPDLPGHISRDVNETYEFDNRATLNPRVNDLFDLPSGDSELNIPRVEDPFDGLEDRIGSSEPINRPPIAGDDQGSTDEDSVLSVNAGQGVLSNDTDPDEDPLEVVGINGDPDSLGSPVPGSGGGTFTVNPDGSYTFDPGEDFQDLADGETRETTITYTVTDDDGNTDEATLTITVTGSNDAPESSTIADQNDSDAQEVSVDVSDSFSDPDSTDDLTYTAEGLPEGLEIEPDTGVISGTVDGSASQGGPDSDGIYSVTITAEDNNGETTSQTFTWTVDNPPPLAEDDTGSTDEDSVLTVDVADGVLDNDSDPDGDSLTVGAVNGSTADVGSPVGGDNGGTITLNPDGSYTFDPGSDFQDLAEGETRETSITYTVDDGEGGTEEATLTITVTGANDGPTSVPIGDQSNSDADSNVEVDVSGSFSDVDSGTDFTYIAEGLPPGLHIDPDTGIISGTVDNSASQGGPAHDGVYNVTITAEDGFESTSRSFTWTVDNPSPDADPDANTTNEEATITVDDQNGVLSNDSDPDADDIAVSEVNGDTGNVGVSTDGDDGGSFTLNADGSYTFAPEDDFQDLAEGETRDTTINYTISDGEGGTSGASLTVTVEGVNDDPDALDDTGATDEDSSISVGSQDGLLDNDSDPDTSNSITVTEIGNGTETEDVENGGTSISGDGGGTFTINPDGSYTFDPGSDFQDLDDGETRETSITYTIDDGNGGTDQATLTITVTGANDAPSPEGTIGDQTNLDADEIASVDVAGAFSDADGDTLSYTATGLPEGLEIDPDTGVISGTIDNSASQYGSGVYSVIVTASDGDESADQAFTWTVTNPAPVAVDDTGKT